MIDFRLQYSRDSMRENRRAFKRSGRAM